MNYFQQGHDARVQLWGGDKEKAAATAKEVIAEGQAEGAEFFPFVTNSEATSSNPDRVFYSEVLFGTYHSSREKLHEDLFAPTLESTSILTLAGTAGEMIYTIMRMITVIRFGLLIIKTELRYSIIANSKSRIM